MISGACSKNEKPDEESKSTEKEETKKTQETYN